jgi:MoxR-like ATPase
MQRPGVIILFDEIDKLSPECFDRLHSLFDSGRHVYDAQIGQFRAHTDTLFVATSNLYGSLPNPIISRFSITTMSAPGEMNEAYKISKKSGIPAIEQMDFASFNKTVERLPDTLTDQIEIVINNAHKLAKVFAELRIKQQSTDYSDKFEYEISLREAEQIFGIWKQDSLQDF